MAIEASAELDGCTPREMYKRVEQTGVLKGLLFDLYDVEHTQSLQHVAEDVLQSLSIRE